jgi:hypothetical protein
MKVNNSGTENKIMVDPRGCVFLPFSRKKILEIHHFGAEAVGIGRK